VPPNTQRESEMMTMIKVTEEGMGGVVWGQVLVWVAELALIRIPAWLVVCVRIILREYRHTKLVER